MRLNIKSDIAKWAVDITKTGLCES